MLNIKHLFKNIFFLRDFALNTFSFLLKKFLNCLKILLSTVVANSPDNQHPFPRPHRPIPAWAITKPTQDRNFTFKIWILNDFYSIILNTFFVSYFWRHYKYKTPFFCVLNVVKASEIDASGFLEYFTVRTLVQIQFLCVND